MRPLCSCKRLVARCLLGRHAFCSNIPGPSWRAHLGIYFHHRQSLVDILQHGHLPETTIFCFRPNCAFHVRQGPQDYRRQLGRFACLYQTSPFWRSNQVGSRALLSRSTAASNSSTSVRCCFRQTCRAALDGCRLPGARISTRRASSRGAGRSSPKAM